MATLTDPIVFSNLLDWAPAGAFSQSVQPGEAKWAVRRGVHGSRSGALLVAGADRPAPELRFSPHLTGWHEVRVRIYHRHLKEGQYGIYAGTARDRALRLLRPELDTEAFETLSLGPRDMTGTEVRLDGAWTDCSLDSVEFLPCQASPPLRDRLTRRERMEQPSMSPAL